MSRRKSKASGSQKGANHNGKTEPTLSRSRPSLLASGAAGWRGDPVNLVSGMVFWEIGRFVGGEGY